MKLRPLELLRAREISLTRCRLLILDTMAIIYKDYIGTSISNSLLCERSLVDGDAVC